MEAMLHTGQPVSGHILWPACIRSLTTFDAIVTTTEFFFNPIFLFKDTMQLIIKKYIDTKFIETKQQQFKQT